MTVAGNKFVFIQTAVSIGAGSVARERVSPIFADFNITHIDVGNNRLQNTSVSLLSEREGVQLVTRPVA